MKRLLLNSYFYMQYIFFSFSLLFILFQFDVSCTWVTSYRTSDVWRPIVVVDDVSFGPILDRP